eukprot:712769-Karenia_brevis.AAC.1
MSSSNKSPIPTTNHSVLGIFASAQAYKAGVAQTSGKQTHCAHGSDQAIINCTTPVDVDAHI